jgi:hypothetical protein
MRSVMTANDCMPIMIEALAKFCGGAKAFQPIDSRKNGFGNLSFDGVESQISVEHDHRFERFLDQLTDSMLFGARCRFLKPDAELIAPNGYIVTEARLAIPLFVFCAIKALDGIPKAMGRIDLERSERFIDALK